MSLQFRLRDTASAPSRLEEGELPIYLCSRAEVSPMFPPYTGRPSLNCISRVFARRS